MTQGKRFQCTFNVGSERKTFESINKAAKEFGIGRVLLTYYIRKKMLFYETKKGKIVSYTGTKEFTI